MDLVGADLSYNWSSWRHLVEKLSGWGVDVSELKFNNDGDHISKKTCEAIADAIEAHLLELSFGELQWLEPHIDAWRDCGGCEQW